MNEHTRIAISDVCLYVAGAFWIAETRYFGWNRQASCDAERLCDSIVVGLGLVAVAFWASGMFTIVMKIRKQAKESR